MIARMKLPAALLLGLSFCATVPCRQSTGDETPKKPSIVTFMSLGTADRIEVSYAPKADFDAHNVRRVKIADAEAVAAWLKELGKIPAEGPGLHIKMLASAPEYRIEFFSKEKHLATLRIKGGRLDAPAGDGWDFYTGEDKVFVKMVEKLFKTR